MVPSTTTWRQFPTLWRGLLDEVWACLRAADVHHARNVMLYLDDVPHVEVGVASAAAVPLTGRVVTSAMPGGPLAMTTHRGSYAGLGAAHQAVKDWCVANGRPRAGPWWEVYGPHRDDPSEVWVEVYYLLAEG